MREFFGGENFFTGVPATAEMISEAEAELGYVLPRAYLDLIRERNGGSPKAACFPTPFPTSWAEDHIKIDAILGLGGEFGIAGGAEAGSRYLIEEWGYPPIGVVICAMPSGGHDAVLLDYSDCGPNGEPAVAYVDEDRVPRRLAGSFAEFLAGLCPCERFETND
ncbi:SMI1/KNR4 family protein [Amycolatopsis cihanbeyliensis]|nr:SMI1/KNR4 family protein [Amycolatopsis cihanbeyliensis]